MAHGTAANTTPLPKADQSISKSTTGGPVVRKQPGSSRDSMQGKADTSGHGRSGGKATRKMT